MPNSLVDKKCENFTNGVSISSQRIPTPLKVRSKGRPRRKQSKVEQVGRRKQQRDKKIMSNEFLALGGNQFTGHPLTYECGNVIATQKSNIITKNPKPLLTNILLPTTTATTKAMAAAAAAATIAKPGSLASLHFHSHLNRFPLLDSSSIRLSSRHSRFCQIKHTTNSSNLPIIRAQTSPDSYFPDSKFYKIEAILRPWRVQQVSSALLKMGIRGVTVSDVRGFGAQGGSTERHGGSEFSEDKFVAKVKIEIVVAKEQVEAVIDKIIVEARTGEIGDGKIFVVPVSDVIRVRTGERGEEAERMTGGRSENSSAV
ncbi:hypothetical protein QYF36_014621 [Acer negundo]|nr:hypothetical protein QYF36_014621 [Acer negundo]